MMGRLASLPSILIFLLIMVSLFSDLSLGNSPNKAIDRIILMDVDNCLYSEALLLNNRFGGPNLLGIEQQIVRNIHAYCKEHLSMSKQKADELHNMFGSTIEGMRHTIGQELSTPELTQLLKQCYEKIYCDLDYTALLQSHRWSPGTLTTGYTHRGSEIAQLRALLEKQRAPLYLASNSPSWHVRKVLQALGLLNVPWAGMITPDEDRDHKPPDGSTTGTVEYQVYPTKYSPSIFYDTILNRKGAYPWKRFADPTIVLIDDSRRNIESLPRQFMRGVHVNEDNPIITAFLAALGVLNAVDAQGPENGDSGCDESEAGSYEFSQVEYLKSKNIVDVAAIHRPTWYKLAKELKSLLESSSEEELQIVDVGAGLLSMLKLVLQGSEKELLPSLVSLLLDDSISGPNLFQRIRYFAYEPNGELQSQCIKSLEEMGFTRQEMNDQSDDELTFVSSGVTDKSHEVIVHLRLYDYMDVVDLPHKPDPQLIVGCCFADLMDPYQLIPSLIERFLANRPDSFQDISRQHARNDCIWYFPITFQGVTQFVPPQPYEIREMSSIPSDTVAFALYSRALQEHHKHNLDQTRLVDAIKAFGGAVISYGAADWNIDPERHGYLWRTMIYFFERVAGPELIKNGWDAAGWLQRACRSKPLDGELSRPSILVSNLDLLFRMPLLGCATVASMATEGEQIEEAIELQENRIEGIQFIAPYKVTTARRFGNELGPNQVQIRSICSLISSGTELKIFTGKFDDAALDVNIKGMEEERMAYPLAYGYSLVGQVVQCGSAVRDAEELIGSLVFTFSAHASHVITDRDAIQIVPEGIEAHDAIFMPSIETAVSIVHDAHIRLGENIAIFGQGLIGLLVTSILSGTRQRMLDLHAPCATSLIGTITTFDGIPSRLAASAAMGASQALLPSAAKESGPFDVAIEVSGNAHALQSAIDNTSNHGRLVVASWYGNADVPLKLGIEFHRSHKAIITSQVSEIKAPLSGLWSKERRFALTWELVKHIRPSRLITKRVTLSEAQAAYEALDNGTEIAVAFDYSQPGWTV